MKNIYESQLIDKFIDKELSAEELEIFKKLYKENDAFRKEVKQRMNIIVGLKAAANIGLKKQQPSDSKIITLIPWYKNKIAYAIAASVAVLLMILGYLYIRPTPNEKLFAFYYQEPPPSKGITIENYDILQKIVNSSSNPDEIARYYFNYAFAAIQKKRYNEAIECFKAILADNNKKEYVEDATWYLGLCYLKINKPREAIKLFHEIIAKYDKHKQDSLEILQRMGAK